MQEYPEQPSDIEELDQEVLTKFITDTLRDKLPDCRVNEWFIKSVNFANMVDILVKGIMED